MITSCYHHHRRRRRRHHHHHHPFDRAIFVSPFTHTQLCFRDLYHWTNEFGYHDPGLYRLYMYHVSTVSVCLLDCILS